MRPEVFKTCLVTRSSGCYSNRLDGVHGKVDALVAAEQIQQHDYALVRPQERKHPNPLTQRTANDPHPRTRPKPAKGNYGLNEFPLCVVIVA